MVVHKDTNSGLDEVEPRVLLATIKARDVPVTSDNAKTLNVARDKILIFDTNVPLAMQFGFSPMATVALVGTAAALGDAGSPASDSTLGPTSGLNVDRQHDHIWDSVVPTFLHYNIPLIAFGWLAAMWL